MPQDGEMPIPILLHLSVQSKESALDIIYTRRLKTADILRQGPWRIITKNFIALPPSAPELALDYG